MRKHKKKLSKVETIIFIIIYTVMITFLICSIYLNLTRKQNEMISVFGYSFAIVQSGSMEPVFYKGDMVLLKQVNTDKIYVGDVIVVYQYEDNADSASLYKFKSGIVPPIVNTAQNPYIEQETYEGSEEKWNQRTPVEAVRDTGRILVFHRVINIYIDDYGTRFFETKGDNNSTKDSEIVREDYVQGMYATSFTFLTKVINFASTSLGLIVVIVIPVIILILSQFWTFGKEIKCNLLASKLMNGKIKFKDSEIGKYRIEDFLSPAEKVFLYDMCEKEERPNLAIIIWDESVNELLQLIDNRTEYYNQWYQKLNKTEQKKLLFLQTKSNLIKTEHLTYDDANEKAKEILKEQKSDGNN